MYQEVDPDADCGNCGAALHSCVNCSNFDTAAQFECRKPIAARLPSKTKANQCELFAEKVTMESQDHGGVSPSDPRAAFDALFK